MGTYDFDPLSYAQLPPFDVAGATALATSLKSAMPAKMPAHVKASARDMIAANEEVNLAWREEPVPTVDDRRPADTAVDRAWAGKHSRLTAYAGLPVAEYPLAARAAELIRVIFPDGLGFLKLPFNQEWAEGQKRLELIDAERLEADLARIAGPEFLEQLRRAHDVYGKVLGITKPSPQAHVPARAEKMKALRKAMSVYVFNVLGQATNDEGISLVQEALRPIDEFRAAAQARRGSARDEGAIEESPQDSPGLIASVDAVAGPVRATSIASPAPGNQPVTAPLAPVIAPAPAPVPVPPAPNHNPS